MAALKPSPEVWKSLLLLGLVVAAYAFVLVGKPLHVDDPHYVAGALHLLEEPGAPLLNLVNWKATAEPAYLDNNNPPFFLYLMAGWMALFGQVPPGPHGAALAMVALGVVAVLSLARRFTSAPYLATALVFTAPTLPPAVNLMLDLPMMSLGAAGLALFVRGVDHDRWPVSLSGAAVAGLAILTKYTAFVLLPVLLLYALLRGRLRHLWTLAAPLGLFAVWGVYNLLAFGELHLLLARRAHSARRHGLHHWWQALWSVTLAFGSSFVFLGVAALRGRHLRRARTWGPLAVVALLLAPAVYGFPGATPPAYWLFAGNALLLLLAAVTGRRLHGGGDGGGGSRLLTWWRGLERDQVFLLLWVAAVAGFHLLFARHQSPRYHYLAFPPFVYLLVRFLAAAPRGWRLGLGWGSVAAQALLALVLVAADDVHARGDRALVRQAVHDWRPTASRVLCLGHWGIQEACRENGVPVFDLVRDEARAGDVFLLPRKSSLENMPAAFHPLPRGARVCDAGPLLQPAKAYSYPFGERTDPVLGLRAGFLETVYRRFPVALMDQGFRADFYSLQFPALPYSFEPMGEPVLPAGQRLVVLRALCDHDPVSRRFDLRIGDPVAPSHLEQGWAQPGPGSGATWSLGERSFVRFVLEAAPGPYRLRVVRSRTPWSLGRRQEVEVRLDGEPVGALEFPSDEVEAEIAIPAGRLRSGVHTLELHHPETFIPSRSRETWAPDGRRLALHLQSLHLEPVGGAEPPVTRRQARSDPRQDQSR